LLYIYSPLQALQQYLPTTIPPTNPQLNLAGPAKAIAFSPNGAFAFVAESSTASTSANLTAFSTCNNQLTFTSNPLVPAAFNLPADPLFMKVLPALHIDGTASLGNPIPDGLHVFVLDTTGIEVLTFTVTPPVSGSLCPQRLDFAPIGPQLRIELGQGTLHPVNFFTSADGAQLYIPTSDNASILVYDFGTGAVSGIPLLGNATPVTADLSVDGGTIVVAGSDGMYHQITTALGGSDQVQLSFPNLPNALNPFCSITPTAGPCTLNVLAIRP